MSKIYEGNCGNCAEFSKYADAREFVESVRAEGRVFAESIAHCNEALESMMEYTDQVLDGDMRTMFGPDHSEFYENIQNRKCGGPRRNWRLLGMTAVCQNPAVDESSAADHTIR